MTRVFVLALIVTTALACGSHSTAPDATSDAEVNPDAGLSGVGATVAFTSYEAEAGTLGGGATAVSLTAPPTTQFSSPELESSGHAYVHLATTGAYVEWINDTGHDVTAIDVRASIPDAPAGGGLTATLALYVDGTPRQTLTLSSKQTWGYEGNDHYNNDSQDPTNGSPRTFFDDVHTFITGAPVAAGGTIRLVKDASSTAAFYDLDVIDVEQPPPAIAQPAGSLSITDYGAVADDPSQDNSAAILACIAAAKAAGKTVWIPPGTFTEKSLGGIDASSVTIEGAGMWYSTIYRAVPLPNGTPLGAIFNLDSTTVRHFALDSNEISRASVDGAGGGMDTTGTDWVADGIWTQHTLSGFWASGTGGTVENCRLTSIWADGININNVSRGATVGNDLTVRNNFVRGTGDDAIAINSVDHNGSQHFTAMSHAVIVNNTSIAPWGGKGVAIYGGSGHIVENNYMSDTARYIGLGVGKFGVNGSDLLGATVKGNTIVRCGGNGYQQQQGALQIGNGGDGQGVGTVANAQVSDNLIEHALFYGVVFSAGNSQVLQANTIDSPGLDGIVVGPPSFEAASGSAALRDNTVTGLAGGHLAFVNLSSGFSVTQSGNNW